MYFKGSLILLMFILISSTILPNKVNDALNELINEAVQVNPRIKMLESKAKSSASRINQDTNLPNPELILGLINMPTNSFSFTQEPMTGKIIGLSQAFPFPGTLSSGEEFRAVDTLIIKQEIEDYKNQLRRDVSKLYYRLQQVREELEINDEIKLIYSKISSVIKSKYQASEATLQNVIQIEIHLVRIEDKIKILERNEEAIQQELNTILHRDESSPIKTINIESTLINNYSNSELVDSAKINRPLLKGIQLAETKSKYMENFVDYDSYPGFKVGIQYTQRDYFALTGQNWSDLFSVVVGISLPINYGGKNSAKVTEAKQLQVVYRDQYISSIQTLRQSIVKSTSKLKELEDREKLVVNDLLSQSEELLNAAMNDYQVGKTDFVNVINAVREILNVKVDLATIRTNYYSEVSELEFLIGKELLNQNRLIEE